VDSILVSSAFLGWPFALFKVLAAAITGLVGGWISDRLPRDEAWQADLGESETEADQSPRGPRAMVVHAHDLLASIWRWLIFGIVVSALINTFLPVGSLEVFENAGPLLAGFLVLLISLPLYVCATASVPIAAALVAGGMPVGAALVFLMAGPATNVATIGAIYRAFGGRQLAAYLAVLIVGSVGFGAIFDLSVGTLAVQQHVHGEAHRTWWAIASAIVLISLIARLAALDLLRVIRSRFGDASAATLEVGVEGLSCGACERKVEKALLAVDGVASAVVSRDPGRAVISGSPDLESIRRAIVSAGYQAADGGSGQ
jgi:copper chaperone CopZ